MSLVSVFGHNLCYEYGDEISSSNISFLWSESKYWSYLFKKKKRKKKKPLNNKKNKKKRTVSKVNKESAKHSRNVSRNLLEDKKKKFSLSERDEWLFFLKQIQSSKSIMSSNLMTYIELKIKRKDPEVGWLYKVK